MTVNQTLSKGLLFLLAATTGLVVANNYYNQPLLGLMAKYFNVSELEISSVPMLTQVGYAVGLFLIVPLGDMLRRKRLILIDFFFIIAALLAAAYSQTPFQLKMASFFIGLTSVVPQVMVPMAAQLAEDEKRGAAIGTVMTGMFIGILGSRTLSGFVGAHLGWQEMFLIAAGIMAALFFALLKFLPEIYPDFKGTYPQLLKSITKQFVSIPKLRLASVRGAFDFGAFTIFWTTVVFLLEGEPFHMGSDVAGSLGLVGIAGATVASFVGRLSDRFNKNTIIYTGTLVIIFAWIVLGFSSRSLIGIIIGAFVLDLGVQSVHITNQTIIFEGNPSARNRINTVYMVWYFVGGAFGTFIGSLLWQYYKWLGVSVAGLFFGIVILIVHFIGTKFVLNKIK
ncbi:MFS transporter [Pedobacter sp. BS3]|uniref:MFS transporter n=1 Tax=Pedobacter sp. BS3 TaxID=2567937 RepID=UPI0011EF7005|nr:MFS transporter [Pedobacter sp. BS3]TZF83558.1 MFS transporter [Pedobacter sp. BS3]